MFYTPDPYGDLEAGRSRREAQRENAARLAHAYAFWTTHGSGEMLAPQPFRFNVSFVDQPSFTHGAVVAESDDLLDGYYPRAHAGVYDWVREVPPGNADGDDSLVPYYIGAYVYFVVDVIGPIKAAASDLGTLVLPQYTITHNLKWEGIAIKDLPSHLLDF